MTDASAPAVTKTQFVQVPVWVLRRHLSRRAFDLYLSLVELADGTNRDCGPSRRRLAKALGCSNDTVDRAMRELVSAGAVVVESQHHADGAQAANLYRLPMDDPSRKPAAPQPQRTRPPSRALYAAPKPRTKTQSQNLERATPSRAGSHKSMMQALIRAMGCEPETKSEWSNWGGVVKELLDAGAAERDVLIRHRRWAQRFPGATCTPRALVNHWGELAADHQAPLRLSRSTQNANDVIDHLYGKGQDGQRTDLGDPAPTGIELPPGDHARSDVHLGGDHRAGGVQRSSERGAAVPGGG